METVNKMGERPFVIAFRSYSGSQYALIGMANDLLKASGTIRCCGGDSNYQWYHDQERKHDFVAQAVAFKTELPVEGIFGVMAGVAERLGGPQREPTPLIKMDLMWVEGVEMETPELTLPNPLIFDKYWANTIFVEASEDVMFRSRDEGREKTSVVRRIAKVYKKYHDMDDPALTFFYEPTSWRHHDSHANQVGPSTRRRESMISTRSRSQGICCFSPRQTLLTIATRKRPRMRQMRTRTSAITTC